VAIDILDVVPDSGRSAGGLTGRIKSISNGPKGRPSKLSKTVQSRSKSIPGGLKLGFSTDPIGTLMDASKKYGDIFFISVGRNKLYLINNPTYINEMYTIHHKDVVKGPQFQRAKRVLGEGLLTSEGEFHHRERRLMQPTFHHERIVSYAKIMTEYIQMMCDQWKEGETLDIHEEMTSVAMRIVAKCLFGTDIKDAKDVGVALSETIEYFDKLASPFGGIMNKLHLTNYDKYEQALKKLNDTVYAIIQEKRKSNQRTGDLLSMLLDAVDAEGTGRMTDEQLRDETMTLFLAGLETTSNALTWAWYLLASNPRAEKKLHDELDRVFPDGRYPTAEDYPKLEYTAKVFKEALRMYPPVWGLGRRTLNDITLGDYFIPAGSIVMLSQYVMHHDPRYYDKPDEFNPDRWTPEMQQKLPKYAYFPFGGGPRGCIGEPFAWMEAVLVLSSVARRWKMNLAKGNNVKMWPRITLRPRNPMTMDISRRAAGS
jgi:cytochrome P450